MYAYGLNIEGLEVKNNLTGEPTLDWHTVTLDEQIGEAPSRPEFQMDADRATMSAQDHARITIRRRDFSAVVESPSQLTPAEIVHPVLSVVGASIARWTGRSAFHGAAVVMSDRTWVLLASPGGGKSTLSSALAARGHAVLSDDLTVVHDGIVLAGPRSCDLREASAVELGRGVRLAQPTGTRVRWREQLPPAPFEVPLGGFVALAWGDELRSERASASDSLALMNVHEALGLGPTAPDSFLRLLPFPLHLVRRVKDWSQLDATADLIEALASR